MNKLDIKTMIKNQNKWVALSPDKSEVLVSGTSIKEVEKKLFKINIKDAILSFIPPVSKYLSPLCQ